MNCPTCNGEGSKHGYICPTCGGSGNSPFPLTLLLIFLFFVMLVMSLVQYYSAIPS